MIRLSIAQISKPAGGFRSAMLVLFVCVLFSCVTVTPLMAARLELETAPLDLPDDVDDGLGSIGQRSETPDESVPAEPAPAIAQPSTAILEDEAPSSVVGGAISASATPASAPSKKMLHLFGYVEFRGKIKNMPKWERVLNEERRRPTFEGDLNASLTPKVAENWLRLREKIKDAPVMEQMKAVNTFFNKWPYKTDIVLWRVEDYWATVREFVRKSGDCEDYAIAKYYALRSLGIPASQLRIVAVIEKIRGIGHAILVVFVNDNAYVLDNLSSMVLVHSRLTNYEPKFSVNEEFRWAHVKPLKKAQ